MCALGRLLLIGGLLAGLTTSVATAPTPTPVPASPPPLSPQVAAYGALPLAFEENRGQADTATRFLAHGQGFSLALMPDALLLASTPSPSAGTTRADAATLRFTFIGASATTAIHAEEPLPGVVNYFLGNDPGRWRTSIPTAARVRYTALFSGIDLMLHGTEGGVFEYDFLVAPGADPASIAFIIAGASEVRRDTASGDLRLATAAGEILQHAPVAYQEINGTRQAVQSRYDLRADGSVGFRIGTYDRTAPLIIDPTVSETYGTYLGGSGSNLGNNRDIGIGIAVDSAGEAFITGDTTSPDFPLQNPFQNALHGSLDVDAYVTKLNAAGTALVYSTYLGGNHADTGTAIAVNAAGEAFITGRTGSTDFPTKNPFQPTNHIPQGTGIGSNAFLTKLNAAGNALVYSTYLGGSGDSLLTFDGGNGIAVDLSGNAYLVGVTNSADFPTKTPLQTSGGAFVAEFNAAGTALVYSTHLGGSGSDAGFAIAVNTAGQAFVTGQTSSTDFPTKLPLQATDHSSTHTAFVTKFSAGGTSLVYSTYLGGSGSDRGNGIAVDTSGNAYITGQTTSADFPTHNPLQLSGNGNGTAFVSEINVAGSAFVYSTYLGGSGGDSGNGIAVDSAGNAYITGQTMSTDFPLMHAFQFTNRDPSAGNAFATKVAASGSALVYSTYLGGSVNAAGGGDSGYGIAVDGAGNAYLTGTAGSTDFPTQNAFQSVNHNPSFNGTGFVVKFASFTAPPSVGLQFYPLAKPVRLLDTRAGATAFVHPNTSLTAGQTLNLPGQFTYQGVTIPASAQAIVGNATVANGSNGTPAGFATLFPSGVSQPLTSNLNFVPGTVRPNNFTVALGADGTFNLYSSSGGDFVIDLSGYYAPAGAGGLYFHPLTAPVRELDTRSGAAAFVHPNATLTAGQTLTLPGPFTFNGITVPAGAKALVGNATVANNANGTPAGFATLYPDDVPLPLASNLNFVPGTVAPNNFTVALGGGDGGYNLYTSSGGDFVIDITGYLDTTAAGGLLFTPLDAPVRELDTRAGASAFVHPNATLGAGQTLNLPGSFTFNGITVPASAKALVGNATVANDGNSTPAGFATLYPGGVPLPLASNLNFVAKQVAPNAVVVGVGSDGKYDLYTSSGGDFVIDISGYFAAPGGAAPQPATTPAKASMPATVPPKPSK